MPPPSRLPASLLFSTFRHRLCRLIHSSSAGHCPQSSSETLEQAGPLACRLASRSMLRFRGPDTVKFLQGLLTNDVRTLAAPAPGGENSTSPSHFPTPNVEWRASRPLYAAMLTPQGRFLYDLFLYRPPLPEEKLNTAGTGPGKEEGGEGAAHTVLADVDATVLDELVECFKKYRLRAKVEIENVSEELCCWQRFGGCLDEGSSEQDPETASLGWGAGADRTASSSSEGNNVGWRWHRDPRLDCLGFRGIFPTNTIPPLVESDKGVEEEHYLLWRLEKGVAEGSMEIPKGDAIPLEYNLVGLNAISFDKGCYVGQEFVARTHHCGVIRKRLLPLKFVDDSGAVVVQRVAPGSVVVDANLSKKVGMVTTALGSRGMGVLRLEEAIGSSSLVIQNQHEVKVNVINPEWWPAEWTQGLKQQSAHG